MGADNIEIVKRLLHKKQKLVVVNNRDQESEVHKWFQDNEDPNLYYVEDIPEIMMSSTKVRKLLEQGSADANIYLDEKVH